MSERDPRVDPRPGDVVVARRRVRGVLSHDAAGVLLTNNSRRFQERMTLFAWRRWARGGEVITRGEP